MGANPARKKDHKSAHAVYRTIGARARVHSGFIAVFPRIRITTLGAGKKTTFRPPSSRVLVFAYRAGVRWQIAFFLDL
jgi:hypothetical protein